VAVAPSPGGFPDTAAFDTPTRRRLADAVRALTSAVLDTASATDDQLGRAATAAEEALRALGAGAEVPPDGRGAAAGTTRSGREHGDYLVRSPLFGALHPSAPPFAFTLDGRELHARGSFNAAHEGPPGYVHGGWVALAFDEALGTTNVAGGIPALTGRLTVRYRHPTPLGAAVLLDARTAQIDGRRVTAHGTMTVDGTITAEAEGLFLTIDAERAREYFGEHPTG
jgi:acyl-coenzyme A thioesterase PaaI-like protein